jgi:hypothetical protein
MWSSKRFIFFSQEFGLTDKAIYRSSTEFKAVKDGGVIYNFYNSSRDFIWFRQNPGLIASIAIIFVGRLVGLFRGGILRKWAAMEVMFFGVVSLISRGRRVQIERSMKYFILQGLGGMVIFFSFFCFGWVCPLSRFGFILFHDFHYFLI